MDTLTPSERSERMSRVRNRGTKPELIVRSAVRELGYRYRLNVADLPGKPDLAFVGRRKVIFVHGCFWHSHPAAGCSLARIPKSRPEFWVPKLGRNRERDVQNEQRLGALGWTVLTIWECELRDRAAIFETLRNFLS